VRTALFSGSGSGYQQFWEVDPDLRLIKVIDGLATEAARSSASPTLGETITIDSILEVES
jgi:hypothetical protein